MRTTGVPFLNPLKRFTPRRTPTRRNIITCKMNFPILRFHNTAPQEIRIRQHPPMPFAKKGTIHLPQIFDPETTLLFGFTNLLPINPMNFVAVCSTTPQKLPLNFLQRVKNTPWSQVETHRINGKAGQNRVEKNQPTTHR
ncbi:hypothetical protein Ancab_040639 [Ancistrocladus abbreviatus]